jgi:hypothetical protein
VWKRQTLLPDIHRSAVVIEKLPVKAVPSTNIPPE